MASPPIGSLLRRLSDVCHLTWGTPAIADATRTNLPPYLSLDRNSISTAKFSSRSDALCQIAKLRRRLPDRIGANAFNPKQIFSTRITKAQ